MSILPKMTASKVDFSHLPFGPEVNASDWFSKKTPNFQAGNACYMSKSTADFKILSPKWMDLAILQDGTVSKNRGTPKWMVYNGNPIKMDDLGVPLFFGNTHFLRLDIKITALAL